MASLRFSLAALATLALTASAAAQVQPPADQQAVAATVGGEPVYVGEVTRPLALFIQRNNLVGRERAMEEAQVLSQLIRQRLVTMHLAKSGALATKIEVDPEITKLEANLKAQNLTLAQALAQQSTSEGDLRRQIRWELSWNKYVAAQLTDAKLEEFFQAHRDEFDGSEVHARHILLTSKPGDTAQDNAAKVARALEIRKEIADGQISFVDAAKKYSQGPSGPDGGELGFFPRHNAMVEPFAKAAFALDIGQVSQPVTSQFGVHLITVTQRKPGTKKMPEVREQIIRPAAAELLEKVAQAQRATIKVEFTGAMPYFKPGTTELVMPAQGVK